MYFLYTSAVFFCLVRVYFDNVCIFALKPFNRHETSTMSSRYHFLDTIAILLVIN